MQIRALFALGLLVCFGLAARADADQPADVIVPKTQPVASPAGTGPEFLRFPQPNLLAVLGDVTFYSLYLGAPDIRGYAYIPNFSPKLGFEYFYKGIGFAATFPLPLPSQEIERRGPSNQKSFVLTRRWRGFGIDAYYQAYKGLYADSPLTEVSGHWPTRFPQLPEAYVLNLGTNAYYVFRPERYSLSAAFGRTEFQTESGGSVVLTPFYNHLTLSIGDVFKPGTDPASPQAPPNLGAGSLDTVGLGVGYGYNYVRGRLFAAGLASAGIGIQYQRVVRIDSGPSENLSPALNLNGNFAAGYINDDWLFGLRTIGSSLSSRLRDAQFSSNLVSAQLFGGGRF